MSGDARRGLIVEAALRLFAQRGFASTTTDDIARAAGISQPYVIRLFGSKRALFVAVVDHAFDVVFGVLGAVPRGHGGGDRLAAMQDAYREIADDREIALMILQAVAAAVDDDVVRSVVQTHVQALHKAVWSAAGGDTDHVREFFGLVMLLNAVTALGVPELLGPDW